MTGLPSRTHRVVAINVGARLAGKTHDGNRIIEDMNVRGARIAIAYRPQRLALGQDRHKGQRADLPRHYSDPIAVSLNSA